MSPLRRLLTIRSRVGLPGAAVSLGHSDGSLLYVECSQTAVAVVAALDYDDAARLHEALGEWLRERATLTGPAPARPAAAPLVAGVINRRRADAGRARTVPFGTVHTADQDVFQASDV
jgi:hypothetical protein